MKKKNDMTHAALDDLDEEDDDLSLLDDFDDEDDDDYEEDMIDEEDEDDYDAEDLKRRNGIERAVHTRNPDDLEDIRAAYNRVKAEREGLMTVSAKREINRDPLRYVPAVSEKEVNRDGQPLSHDRVLLGSAIGLRMLNASREKRRDPELSQRAQSWAREARINLDAVEVGVRDLSNETAIWVEVGAWNAAKDALWRLRGLINLMTNISTTRDFAEWDEEEQEEWSTVLRLSMSYDTLFEEAIITGVSHAVKSQMN